MEVRFIATHTAPHWEELVAIFIALRFGHRRFQGIEGAQLLFWDRLPEGKTAEELHHEGYLLIGIGGGRYDEHPSANEGRKENQCSATLLAEDLGIRNDPALKILFDFTLSRDLNLGENILEAPALIKNMWESGRWPVNDVLGWAFMALDAHYDSQYRFHADEVADAYKKAFKRNIVIGNEKKGLLVWGKSDSEKFMPYARSRHAAIVVQQTQSGNVKIQSNQNLRIDLTDVARMIRTEELRLRKQLIPNWEILGRESEIASWYLHPHRGMLLNGSKTKSAEPTKLHLQRIISIIENALNPKLFPTDRTADCLSGQCTSSRQNPCYWFRMGISRCMAIRHNPVPQAMTHGTKQDLVTIT